LSRAQHRKVLQQLADRDAVFAKVSDRLSALTSDFKTCEENGLAAVR